MDDNVGRREILYPDLIQSYTEKWDLPFIALRDLGTR